MRSSTSTESLTASPLNMESRTILLLWFGVRIASTADQHNGIVLCLNVAISRMVVAKCRMKYHRSISVPTEKGKTMTEFISRKYGNDGFEVIIKTDSHEHYRAAEEFARRLIDHAKPVTGNNVGSKWIPVTERLPSLHEDVLMYFKDDDNMAVGYLDDVDEDRTMWSAYSDGGYYTDCDFEPTHWMPLPEPPKEVE